MPRYLCKQCHEELTHTATVEKDDIYWLYYWCFECQRPTHRMEYRYSPALCPKHAWEFITTEFYDNGDTHEIYQTFRCDRCGAVHKQPRHRMAVGDTGKIEIEDPRVQATLALNRSALNVLGDAETKDLLDVRALSDHVILPEECHI